jgi:hypothetical protein
MLRILNSALKIQKCAYSAMPQPKTNPEILYTGVSGLFLIKIIFLAGWAIYGAIRYRANNRNPNSLYFQQRFVDLHQQ